jgi:hypothetical protein
MHIEMKMTPTQKRLFSALVAAETNDARIEATEGYSTATIKALERRGLIEVERYWSTETRSWNGVCYPTRLVMQYRTITVR